MEFSKKRWKIDFLIIVKFISAWIARHVDVPDDIDVLLDSPHHIPVHDLHMGERTRLSGGFTGRPRCDAARDLLGQLFQLLASPALGGAQCGRVGFVPALLLAIGTHRFGVIRLPTIRQ